MQEIKNICLRARVKNGQEILVDNHTDCPQCPNFHKCPDPTVMTMRENIPNDDNH